MKVYVSVTAKCTYIGELEMTQAQYDALNEQMDKARGSTAEDIAVDLIDRFGALDDPTSYDDFEVDEFRPLPAPTVPNVGEKP